MSERHHWDAAKRCFVRTPVPEPRPTIPPAGVLTFNAAVIAEIMLQHVRLHFLAPAAPVSPRDAGVHRAIAATKRADATR